jgi:glyoxylase-like metal-dependent hydrolase (beta-lactamase superfamily II)
MVDAGMDVQVHRFFGRGVEEPYDAAAAQRVEQALRAARSIVVTHEHGDHIAGVVRGPMAEQLAAKTLLTRAQADALMNRPQMPELKLTPAQAARFQVADYEKYLPYGPGMALIKSAGHTPGSQMVFIALESGREYLLIGDAAWHMDSVRQQKGKDAPWVREDVAAVTAQLNWLHELDRSERNLFVITSHDEEQHKQLVDRGVLGSRLE